MMMVISCRLVEKLVEVKKKLYIPENIVYIRDSRLKTFNTIKHQFSVIYYIYCRSYIYHRHIRKHKVRSKTIKRNKGGVLLFDDVRLF